MLFLLLQFMSQIHDLGLESIPYLFICKHIPDILKSFLYKLIMIDLFSLIINRYHEHVLSLLVRIPIHHVSKVLLV